MLTLKLLILVYASSVAADEFYTLRWPSQDKKPGVLVGSDFGESREFSIRKSWDSDSIDLGKMGNEDAVKFEYGERIEIVVPWTDVLRGWSKETPRSWELDLGGGKTATVEFSHVPPSLATRVASWQEEQAEDLPGSTETSRVFSGHSSDQPPVPIHRGSVELQIDGLPDNEVFLSDLGGNDKPVTTDGSKQKMVLEQTDALQVEFSEERFIIIPASKIFDEQPDTFELKILVEEEGEDKGSLFLKQIIGDQELRLETTVDDVSVSFTFTPGRPSPAIEEAESTASSQESINKVHGKRDQGHRGEIRLILSLDGHKKDNTRFTITYNSGPDQVDFKDKLYTPKDPFYIPTTGFKDEGFVTVSVGAKRKKAGFNFVGSVTLKSWQLLLISDSRVKVFGEVMRVITKWDPHTYYHFAVAGDLPSASWSLYTFLNLVPLPLSNAVASGTNPGWPHFAVTRADLRKLTDISFTAGTEEVKKKGYATLEAKKVEFPGGTYGLRAMVVRAHPFEKDLRYTDFWRRVGLTGRVYDFTGNDFNQWKGTEALKAVEALVEFTGRLCETMVFENEKSQTYTSTVRSPVQDQPDQHHFEALLQTHFGSAPLMGTERPVHISRSAVKKKKQKDGGNRKGRIFDKDMEIILAIVGTNPLPTEKLEELMDKEPPLIVLDVGPSPYEQMNLTGKDHVVWLSTEGVEYEHLRKFILDNAFNRVPPTLMKAIKIAKKNRGSETLGGLVTATRDLGQSVVERVVVGAESLLAKIHPPSTPQDSSARSSVEQNQDEMVRSDVVQSTGHGSAYTQTEDSFQQRRDEPERDAQ